ncbi:MAG: cyclase family protein [Verrucomicrobiota bacterium]
MTELFDISRTLCGNLAPWPGDTPFRFELNWKMAEGATVNVGKMEMGVHNGSHADAPFHFAPTGKTIDRLSLETFIGPAAVADLTNIFRDEAEPREIAVADLEPYAGNLIEAPRLLLKTDWWRDSTMFPSRIPVIAADVPSWLKARGVVLLGLDLPSVDPIDSKDLSNHHALAKAGIAIVEGLDLSQITAGRYNFAALPLKIAGGDAGPVRAILWREQPNESVPGRD